MVYSAGAVKAIIETAQLLEPHLRGIWATAPWVLGVLVAGWGLALILVAARRPPAVTVHTVLVGGRAVHYSTDEAEAEQLAALTGGVVERAADRRWYSVAELRHYLDGIHPADWDIAIEYWRWQHRLDEADARGTPAPPLRLTGPPDRTRTAARRRWRSRS
ncbi:hypothetical protein BU204_20745 [Actinophytocola xanthii]|uniref:Uncharacterized protein n=2 Tax=Actinophytocola xanthii TaxID=1912961 RepID=A0A1Q8CMT8_9PSEU|nr:hypothetical protein BU204_20745 [Actinophytocola xanthii]